ncbi:MAG: 6-phosphofructokinase [Clostridia bacterium]|nr:6-phosphofructokinase [Clostridia bacterium]
MNIAVAQSGGPTCAINASLLGVFRHATKYEEIETVYGSVNGVEGLILDNFVNLCDIISDDEDVELIRQTPSTVLGSCRYKLPDYKSDSTIYETILSNLLRHNIGAFFYIGGNDSMDTVMKLDDYFKANNIDIKVIGIPKTIDNDLPETDHTPGFGSAAKYVATSLQEIIRDSSVYSSKSVTIVEIMGRDTGWLTASSAILRANGEVAPHLIYLPEVPFSVKKFIKDVKAAQEKYYAVIVAVSEGITLNADEICDEFQSGKSDNFGHKYLAGVGKALEKVVSRELGCKVRSIELNVMQRCSSHLSSKRDITEAERIGGSAVKIALDGFSGRMMIYRRISNHPYNMRIEHVDVRNVANKVKYFPTEWITESQNNVTDEAIEYCLPLIQGEQNFHIKNGLPKHYVLRFNLPREKREGIIE